MASLAFTCHRQESVLSDTDSCAFAPTTLWSVTPATVGFGATDIFETFTDRCQSVFNDTDSGVVTHTILLSGYQDSVTGSENRPYKESGKFNDC